MTRKTATRQERRPETDTLMYWYPKLKQWLSLNQALYLKSLEANRDNRID